MICPHGKDRAKPVKRREGEHKLTVEDTRIQHASPMGCHVFIQHTCVQQTGHVMLGSPVTTQDTMIAKIQQHVARHILVIQPRSGAVESSKLLLSSHLCNDIGLRILADISSLSPGQVATGVSAHGTSTIHSLQVPQICHCKCHRVLDSSSLASPPAVYSLIVASHALSA